MVRNKVAVAYSRRSTPSRRRTVSSRGCRGGRAWRSAPRAEDSNRITTSDQDRIIKHQSIKQTHGYSVEHVHGDVCVCGGGAERCEKLRSWSPKRCRSCRTAGYKRFSGPSPTSTATATCAIAARYLDLESESRFGHSTAGSAHR